MRKVPFNFKKGGGRCIGLRFQITYQKQIINVYGW